MEENFEVGYEVDEIEPQHVDTLMEGLIDTVDGNEGFNLSYAQHYAFAAMGAAGQITAQQQRMGAEGFLDSVGNGIKAIWDFIVNTMKKIWNFFFGSGEGSGESETTEVEKKVKKKKEKVKAAENGTQSDAEVGEELASVQAAAEAIASDPEVPSSDQNEAKAIVEQVVEAKKAGTVQSKKKAVSQAVKKLPKLNSKQKRTISENIKKAIDAKTADLASVNSIDVNRVTEHSGLKPFYVGTYESIKSANQDAIKLFEDVQSKVKSGDVTGVYTNLENILKENKKSLASTRKIKEEMKSTQDELQKQLKEAESSKDETLIKDLKTKLASYKQVLVLLTRSAGSLSRTNAMIRSLADQISAVSGLK